MCANVGTHRAQHDAGPTLELAFAQRALAGQDSLLVARLEQSRWTEADEAAHAWLERNRPDTVLH
jgi:hypothetical protein